MSQLTPDQSFELLAIIVLVMGTTYVVNILVESQRQRQRWRREDEKIRRDYELRMLELARQEQAEARRAEKG